MIKHSTTNSYKSIPHPLVLENSFSFLTYGSFPMGVHFGIRVEMLSFLLYWRQNTYISFVNGSGITGCCRAIVRLRRDRGDKQHFTQTF